MTHSKIFFRLLSQATPLVLSNCLSAIGSMISMFFLARQGHESLAAGALMTSVYGLVIMVVISFFYAISGLVGYHRGASQPVEIGKIVTAGAALAACFTLPLTLLFSQMEPLLLALGQPLGVSHQVGEYFYGLQLGIFPSLLLAVCSQFLMGISQSRFMVVITVVGVVSNAILSYQFIVMYEQGAYGAGIASSMTSVMLSIALVIGLLTWPRFRSYRLWQPSLSVIPYFKSIVTIGFPISIQYSAEILAFTLITLLTGWFGTDALAAQQITIQCSMITIMIVMGISQAATVITSQSIGQGALSVTRQINHHAFSLGIVLMLFFSVIYIEYPDWVIALYATDLTRNLAQTESFRLLATHLLWITAVTQLLDAVRNIAAGLLRGFKNTKMSMWTGLVSCWFIGLPIGILLAFFTELGVYGLRLGMLCGIAFASIRLLSAAYSEAGYHGTLSQLNREWR